MSIHTKYIQKMSLKQNMKAMFFYILLQKLLFLQFNFKFEIF